MVKTYFLEIYKDEALILTLRNVYIKIDEGDFIIIEDKDNEYIGLYNKYHWDKIIGENEGGKYEIKRSIK